MPTHSPNNATFSGHLDAYGMGPPSSTLSLCPWQVEAVSDSDTESRSQREFHSIGVQVEEDKRYAPCCALPSSLPSGFPHLDSPGAS